MYLIVLSMSSDFILSHIALWAGFISLASSLSPVIFCLRGDNILLFDDAKYISNVKMCPSNAVIIFAEGRGRRGLAPGSPVGWISNAHPPSGVPNSGGCAAPFGFAHGELIHPTPGFTDEVMHRIGTRKTPRRGGSRPRGWRGRRGRCSGVPWCICRWVGCRPRPIAGPGCRRAGP